MRFTITDNPGLVPLSSLNVGLGHAFLRHIERCSALVYVIDLSAEDPVGGLDAVRKELREYARMNGLHHELEGRVRGVVANKADLFGERAVNEAGVAEAEDEDPLLRSTREEGMKKLEALREYILRVETEEIEEGIRKPEDKIWIVPTSAKKRENVAVLVQRLAETVRVERKRTLEKIRLEEEEVDNERSEAVERLANTRGGGGGEESSL